MSDQAFAIFQITYSLIMTSAVGCIAAFLKSHFSSNKISKQTDMLLLRQALINIHDESMAQGYITRYSFKTFNEIWELYHTGYKGNTLTDKFHDEVCNLPMK